MILFERMYEAATNFFQCDCGDLTVEDRQDMGARTVKGGYSQSWLFSADHTETKCVVTFDAAFDTVEAAKYDERE